MISGDSHSSLSHMCNLREGGREGAGLVQGSALISSPNEVDTESGTLQSTASVLASHHREPVTHTLSNGWDRRCDLSSVEARPDFQSRCSNH